VVFIGTGNLGWLTRLRNSARNSRDVLSPSFVSLTSPKSNSIIRPGKAIASSISNGTRWRQTIRSGVKPASHGHHACPVGTSSAKLKGFPIRSGRSPLTTDSVPALSNPRTGLKGTLLHKVPIQESCQPLSNLAATPVTSLLLGDSYCSPLVSSLAEEHLVQFAPTTGMLGALHTNCTHVMRLERYCVFYLIDNATTPVFSVRRFFAGGIRQPGRSPP
jgi:hypothetical protein